jgi:hypothetical protein
MTSRPLRLFVAGTFVMPLVRLRGAVLKAVAWLRADYPADAPRTGYCPLIALQGPASLTTDQIARICDELAAHPGETTAVDIEAAILKITDRLPHPRQVAQIHRNQTR